MSQRLAFYFSDAAVEILKARAVKAGCDGKDDRELIYQYFCCREGIEPVKRGGRREEAIEATKRYQKQQRAARLKLKKK